MIGFFADRFDAMLGRGRHSCAVPVMDGPLQPNLGLDEADIVFEMPGVDNLVPTPDGLMFSSEKQLYLADKSGGHVPLAVFSGTISCIAAAPGGALALGIDGEGIVINGGTFDGQRIERLDGQRLLSATAALFMDDETLIIASGSADYKASDWKLDLMSQGKTGLVWRLNLAHQQAECLAKGLAYPYGLCATPAGSLLVSEAWHHRLLQIDGKGALETVLQDLPGYPARITPASGSGYWLTLFAPRNQLVEFVLREHSYRRDMITRVPQEYWIAPALASGASFKEPLQGGAVKQMGILKPWAPGWSYGLVVRLDPDFQPVESWHSRTDRDRHGITSVCEMDGMPIVSAKGRGLALALKNNSSPEDDE